MPSKEMSNILERAVVPASSVYNSKSAVFMCHALPSSVINVGSWASTLNGFPHSFYLSDTAQATGKPITMLS